MREYINWYNYHRPQEKLKGMIYGIQGVIPY
ncbi:IS3 family transposase [Streptococcus mutans]